MNYTEFKKELLKQAKSRYPDAEDIQIKQIEKNNGLKVDSLMVKSKGRNIAPAIHLKHIYDAYNGWMEADEIMSNIFNELDRHDGAEFEGLAVNFFDMGWVKEHLMLKLINKKANKAQLKDAPHVNFLDLAVVFALRIEAGDTDAMILVKNEHLDAWSLSKDEVFEIAKRNMQKNHPPKAIPLEEIMMQAIEWASAEGIEGIDGSDQQSAPPAYVITNDGYIYGASAVVYSDILKKLAEKIGSDLIIIPSSVHEVIAYHSWIGASTLNDLIKEVNATKIEPQDMLSDHAYRYIRKVDEIVYDINLTAV